MPLEARVLTGLGLATVIAYCATPLAIRVADRFDFYDRPAGGYKNHSLPTPYLGGAAVMVAFLLAVATIGADWRTLPLAGGVVTLWLVGTLDDRRPLPVSARLAIEGGVGLAMAGLGLGWNLGLGGMVDVVATVIWVVAIVNAFNIFDNMDGVAGSMGGVMAAGIAVLGMVQGDAWLSVASIALCGACLGFLPHNMSSPARIFLGDGGSMPIGFALATLAMIGLEDAAPEWQSLGMGTLFVAVPTLDMCMRILARKRQGQSIFTGGRDGLAHWSRRRVRTARGVAFGLGAAQAMISALAVVATNGGSATTVIAVATYLVLAALVLAVLDVREVDAPSAAAEDGAVPPRGAARALPVAVFAVPLGVALGASPFFSGFYDSRVWVPAALACAALVAAGAIAGLPRLTRPAILALCGLAGLGLWALTSSVWADSIEQAVVEGNRFLGYAVLLGVLLLTVRTRVTAAWLLATIGTMGVALAGVTIVRMLSDDPASLFVAGRLDAPLGYINGLASFFLLSLWICVAVGELRRSAVLAGVGTGAATLLAGLLLLSQSRGVAVAAAASLAVVMLAAPGRLRRAWALVFVSGGVAFAAPDLLDVYRSRAGGVDAEVSHTAAATLLVAALAVGLAWGAAAAVVSRAGTSEAALRRAAAAALAVAALTLAAVALPQQATIRHTLSQQYTAFVRLGIEPQGSSIAEQTPTSRLVTGAGTRYDYWRVAWHAWKEAPVRGVGAGNYDKPYFSRRATSEDVRQPHSIELQTLSELGLVGGALLLLFLAGVGWAAVRAQRVAARADGARFLFVAGTGILAAWLVHTSVDWLHLLPGVTGIALAAAVGLLVAADTGGRARPARTPGAVAARRLVPALVVAAVLVVASVSLSRQALAEYYRDEAQAALKTRPADALVQADHALRVDREAIRAYYVKAAALARFGEAAAARASLLEAAEREPRDFVTWTLLGDLAVRMDDLREARAMYARAHALNPRDPSLRELARNPEAVKRTLSPQ